jgi:hypothetical protein
VHSQPFAGAYIHADKAGSKKGACFADGFEDHAAWLVMPLNGHIPDLCVCIQEGYAGHCLSEGKGGRLDSLSAWTKPHSSNCTWYFMIVHLVLTGMLSGKRC